MGWLDELGCLGQGKNLSNPEHLDLMKELTSASHTLLALAKTFCKKVSIVTNARRPWVLQSAVQHMPSLLPLLQDESTIEIKYAREYLPGHSGALSGMAKNPSLFNGVKSIEEKDAEY